MLAHSVDVGYCRAVAKAKLSCSIHVAITWTKIAFHTKMIPQNGSIVNYEMDKKNAEEKGATSFPRK